MYVQHSKTILILSICSFFFLGTACFAATPTNVDMNKIKTTRISRTNGERTSLKIKAYTGNLLLNNSAQEWAEHLQAIGKATHLRLTGDGYYNYSSIKDRFALQHVGFSNAEGTMFSESLGRGYYTCTKADCTDALLKSIKSTRNFFMSEKYKKSRPHYNAIVSKSFNGMGLGIAVTKNRYYLVAHYGKNVIAIK